MNQNTPYNAGEVLLKKSTRKFYSMYFLMYFLLIASSYLYFFVLFVMAICAGALAVASVVSLHVIYLGVFLGSICLYTLHDLGSLLFQKNSFVDKSPSVDRKKYPRFDTMLSEVERDLGVKVRKVFIDTNYNASADSSSRFLFIGQKNILRIGLPILLSFSPDQVKWVISHELGHMSRKHGIITSWSRRTYYSLLKLYVQMGQRKNTHMLIRPFFSWIWPRLSSFQFALSKKFEFDVDSDASKIASKESGIQALINLAYNPAILGDFFKNTYRHARHVSWAPQDIYVQLEGFLNNQNREKNVDAEKRVVEELKEQTNPFDSHPALQDRLAAINGSILSAEAVLSHIKPVSASAFSAYFSDNALLIELSKWWAEMAGEGWKRTHERYVALEKLREEFKEGKDSKVLEKIVLAQSNLEGYESAEEDLNMLLELDPENKNGLMMKLAQYVNNSDENNSRELAEKIIVIDPMKTETALQMLAHMYSKLDKKELVEELKDRIIKFRTEHQSYIQKISTLQKTDTLTPASITDEDKAKILDAVKDSKIVKEIRIADKEIDILGSKKQLVLILISFTFAYNRTARLNAAVSKLAAPIFGEYADLRLRNRIMVPAVARGFSWIKKATKGSDFQTIYKSKRSPIIEPFLYISVLAGAVAAVLLLISVLVMQETGSISPVDWITPAAPVTQTYFDPEAGVYLTFSDYNKWAIESKPDGKGWRLVSAARRLTSDEVASITVSPFALDPNIAKHATDTSFVNLNVDRYEYSYMITDPDEWSNKDFLASILRSEQSDPNTPEKVVSSKLTTFQGHMAYVTDCTYQNIKLGDAGKSRIITFIYKSKGYAIVYSAANPLFDKFNGEVQQTIDSIKIQ